MRSIEMAYLEPWADSEEAKSRFPYLVRQLISVVIQPEKLRIPFGDVIWLPGFDGVVAN